MAYKSWGNRANEVINKAEKELSHITNREELYSKISRDYYPFGVRKHWPYTAWLKAIKRRLYGPKKRNIVQPVDENQTAMF